MVWSSRQSWQWWRVIPGSVQQQRDAWRPVFPDTHVVGQVDGVYQPARGMWTTQAGAGELRHCSVDLWTQWRGRLCSAILQWAASRRGPVYCLTVTISRLYSSCVQSSVLHGSETWPVRKENEMALQRAEMRMVRWMCNVKVKDRVPSKELRERLWIHDRLRWYGHVLQKEDTDWVKKCIEYEVEGSRPRGRPKRT